MHLSIPLVSQAHDPGSPNIPPITFELIIIRFDDTISSKHPLLKPNGTHYRPELTQIRLFSANFEENSLPALTYGKWG